MECKKGTITSLKYFGLSPLSAGVPNKIDNTDRKVWFQDYCGDPSKKDGIKACTDKFLNSKAMVEDFDKTCTG